MPRLQSDMGIFAPAGADHLTSLTEYGSEKASCNSAARGSLHQALPLAHALQRHAKPDTPQRIPNSTVPTIARDHGKFAAMADTIHQVLNLMGLFIGMAMIGIAVGLLVILVSLR